MFNIQWCFSQTEQHFIMFITVLGQHVSILIESSSAPSKNTDPYLATFKMRCGIQNDDSVRIETCCPNKNIKTHAFYI